ncbi:MAG: hypothetical protein JJU28_07195 [Cyclobacteriaceae bacterium]|nr:hypothetical protein [Cyclobacteriaceae bacterium]
MGLTIHYSGQLKSTELINPLLEDIAEIAGNYDWKFDFLDSKEPSNGENGNLRGIVFQPPKCDAVFLLFDVKGQLINPVFVDEEDYDEINNLHNLRTQLFVKTQFASPALHIQLVHIFEYLANKYFQVFAVLDDGEYWETKDASLLAYNFKKNQALIDQFALGLETIPINEGEDLTDFLARVGERVKRYLEGKGT